MTAPAALDLSTLALIRTEVERSLDEADATLARATSETAGSEELSKARRLLAGVPEALELAGVRGLPIVLHAIDALLADLQTQDGRAASESVSLCRRACSAVRAMLADTQALANPLPLAPTYGQLLRARGDDRLPELDLFFPDFEQVLDDTTPDADLVRTVDVRATLAAHRVRYQEALLKWLRESDAQALREMLGAVEGAARVAQSARSRGFWRVAAAVLDLLAAGTLSVQVPVKRLCSALDQDLRRTGDGSEPASDSLRTMLYFVWSAPGHADSERVAAVRQAYALHAIRRGADDDARARAAMIARLRNGLEPLKPLWESACEGERGALQDFQWQVGALRAACTAAPGLERLLDLLAQAAKRDPASGAEAGVDVATLLLLLENLCATGTEPQRALQRAQELVAAVEQSPERSGAECLRGAADGTFRDSFFRDPLTSEMLAALMRAQERLTAYFEDASRRSELDLAGKALGEVRGALEILGEPDAVRALTLASELVAAMAGRDGVPDEAQVRRVAGVVSAVLHFVEQMRYGGADVRALLSQVGLSAEEIVPDAASPAPGQAEVTVPPAARVEPAPSLGHAAAASTVAPAVHPIDQASDPEMLSVFLEEAKEVLAAMGTALAQMRMLPGNADALASARRGVHTLKGSGRMVGLTHLGEVAWAVERALNRWLEQKLPASQELVRIIEIACDRFGAWIQQLQTEGAAAVDGEVLINWAEAVRKGEPLPSTANAETSQSTSLERTVQIGAVRLSPALYKVYVSEAEQRLGHMLARFDELRADHSIATVSEAFVHEAHTLAGISGTTGFTAVYQLGEQLELVLQQLYRVPVRVDPSDQELLGRTLSALSGMVDCVRRRTPPEAAPALVDALQNLLRRLEANAAQARASAVTVQAPMPGESPTHLPEGSPSAPAAEAERPAAAPVDDRRQMRLQDDPDEALLPLFLQEAADLVPQVGHWLREWRGQRDSPEIPAALQRLLHTLKGSARMAGAMAVGELTHSMESRVESAMRTPIVLDTLLNGLEASLDRLGLLIDRLQHPEQRPAPAQLDGGSGAGGAPRAQQQPMLRVRAALVDRLVNEAGELAVTRARAHNELKGLRQSLTDLTDSIIRLRSQVREIEIQAESQIQSRVAVTHDGADSAFDPLEFDRYTRLQELTRFLAESVNDLVTVQHGMLERVDGCNAGLTAQSQITRVLQDELLGMRLTPVAALTERLYRVARLTARETGKPTRFDIIGGQVEMDRAILERMAGPLEHVLRNAIVHGIEDAAARRAAGKPETGQVTLEVRQEGNEVLLMLSDDGAGLDLERIRRKAVDLGVIAADQPLSDADVGNLVFAAGVSTAAAVTQAAGRGVGLDAVRSEVSTAGGRVEVKFERGRGSRFLIHLPVTLSVLHALVVRCAERPYALPAQMVDQVRTLKPEELEQAYAEGVVSFGGREYPVRHLQHLLGEPGYSALRQRFNPLVLVHSGTDCLALHVDALAGNQEIVIKGIGEQVARVTGITGAAMLGTGEAVLILNPVLLAQGRIGPVGAPAWRKPQAPVMTPLRPVVMVVDDSITVRKITGRLLAREGYEALEARDGVEALERLSELRPDVVLTDIEMPRMDGFDLIRQLRGETRWRDVPVIVISSRTADKHRELARELGADVFLGKPYRDEELLEQIARLIGAPAAEPAQQEPRV